MIQQTGVEMRTWKNGRRYYYFNGKKCISVTNVIKQLGWSSFGLDAWRKYEFEQGRNPWDIANKAATLGSMVHEMIECHIYQQDEYIPPEGTDTDNVLLAAKGLAEYIKWSDENVTEYLESEIRMVSEKLLFAGTADSIALINGKTVLLDFKTSKAVRAEHIIQLSAYKHLIEETTNYKIDSCAVIRIEKEAVPEGEKTIIPHFIDDEMIEKGWEVFTTCLELKAQQKIFDAVVRKINK